MTEQRVQLFTSAGRLVVTASIALKDGKWPDSVRYAEQRYVLKDGRYVRVEAESDTTKPVEPNKLEVQKPAEDETEK